MSFVALKVGITNVFSRIQNRNSQTSGSTTPPGVQKVSFSIGNHLITSRDLTDRRFVAARGVLVDFLEGSIVVNNGDDVANI